MAAQSDVSVGYKAETTYGTAVTVDRWLGLLDESFDYKLEAKQGKALYVGASGVPVASRRFVPTKQGSGDLTVEAVSKGMGTLWRAALGSGTSTLVSGTTYQQWFTLGDACIPLTIQKGLVDYSGTVNPYTFAGCVATGFEFSVPHTDVASLKVGFDVQAVSTATAYASPSYASDPTLYHWGMAAITVGGTVTVPTATTLATGGTAITNGKDFSVSVDHGVDASTFRMGGSGLKAKPVPGERAITGSLTVDYTDNVLRDALLADTAVPITVTLTSTESLSSGYATLQIVIPEAHIDGDLPKANGGKAISTTYKWTGLYNETDAPLYVVLRTADSAL